MGVEKYMLESRTYRLMQEFVNMGANPIVYFFLNDITKFDTAKRILKKKYKLVEPREPIVNGNNCLVWEDESNIGRFRITLKVHSLYGPMIMFRYWPQRLTKEVMERNPMKEPLYELKEVLQPHQIVNHELEEIVLD